MVRILQAMQDTRTAFRLYLVENGLNIVFGVALVGPLGVRGLALSLSIAYTAAAALALAVIRQRVGGLGGDELTIPVKRVLGASGVMAVATVLALNVSGAPSGVGLLARVVLAVVVGLVAYVATAGRAGPARRPPDAPAAGCGRPAPALPSRARRTGRPGRRRGRRTTDGPTDGPTDEPFHGRLDDQSPRCTLPAACDRCTDEPEDEQPPGDEEESMARIRVVTDSACDLSAELAAERNLTIVPLSIRFGSEEFVDGSTLTTDEFWARCAASRVLPETSAPSPGAFQEAFLAAAADGYDGVLCISLSSEVSATYQAAVAAAKAVSDQIPVRTIDSRSLTMGLGLIVLDAADAGRRPAPRSTSWSSGSRRSSPAPRCSGCWTPSSTSRRAGGSAAPGPSSVRSCPSSRWWPWSTAWSRRSRSSAPGAAPCAIWPTRPWTRRRSAGWPCATARPPTSTSSSPC